MLKFLTVLLFASLILIFISIVCIIVNSIRHTSIKLPVWLLIIGLMALVIDIPLGLHVSSSQTTTQNVSSSTKRLSKSSLKKARAEVRQSSIASSESMAKLNNDYPQSSNVFPSGDIKSYSDDQLYGKNIRFTGTVEAITSDNEDNYHILLGENDGFDYLVVTKSIGNIELQQNDKVTVYGTTNGKSKINEAQINTGFDETYFDRPVVLLQSTKFIN